MECLFHETWPESRPIWRKRFLNNFSVKWNRKECLLNLCYVTGSVLTDISSLCIGALAGVFLWKGDEGKERKGRGQMIAPALLPQWSVWSSSTPVKRWRSCSCIWYSFSLQLDCLAPRIISGYFLITYFIFALLKLLPSASFSVYNACYHSVANCTLFAGHIYAMYFSPNFFWIYKLQIIQGQWVSYAVPVNKI